jgi:putative isomerase
MSHRRRRSRHDGIELERAKYVSACGESFLAARKWQYWPGVRLMLRSANIRPDSAWNTWSDQPGEMVFLPLGVRVTPVLYSSSARKTTAIRATPDVLFGRHGLHGETVSFETTHGGTGLRFTYAKPEPFFITGGWSVTKKKEWGLRYWVIICLSAESGEDVCYSEADDAATVMIGQRAVALASGDVPLLVTGHDSIENLIADMDATGYFDPSKRSVRAKVIALRFNLEMMPSARFAAAVADSRPLAIRMAKAALGAETPAPAALQSGVNAGALDAVRDVLGWNTLYDRINSRPYTAISRIWNIGDFAVWFNDQTMAAMMAGVLDAGLARSNLEVALASATPQGNFACLLTSRDSWVDRTQAPHGALMTWLMYLRSHDRSLLDLAYEPLKRNHMWWRENRDPDGLGLVSCGTSDVGNAMYKGTAFGARNETGMDNSATHDEAVYDPVSRTLSTVDLGLNCALALDAEMLGHMAQALGRRQEQHRFEALAADTRRRISLELWDETRGLFANRQRNGGFVSSVGPTSFYPLLCGAASDRQARRLLAHLDDSTTFGGAYGLPNAARNDPAYHDNVYWRGRIWPHVNYFVWQGLRRYGFEAEAGDLVRKSLALFEQSWTTRRLCGENYNAESGEIDDQGDADPFYTWGAMLPLLGVAEVMDIAPWNGWQVTNTGAPVQLGPLTSPAGAVTLTVEDGWLTLATGAGILFSTNLRGRICDIVVDSRLLSLRLLDGGSDETMLRIGPDLSARVWTVRRDGSDIASRLEDGCCTIDLMGFPTGGRLDFHLLPAQ